MKIFGLTGKTGAGKTTVSELLSSMGFYVINGDHIARNVTAPGKPALKELAAAFGFDIVDENGVLDRALLASRAFADKNSTALLNSITHPYIRKDFEAEIEKAALKGYEKVVLDAAALLESNCKDLCSSIIVVSAPKDIRLKRILSRDGISEKQAETRMKAQFPDEYYEKKADIIIKNYPPFDKDIKAQLCILTENTDEN